MSDSMSFQAQQMRAASQRAYRWGHLRLAYEFVSSVESYFATNPEPKVQITGDPAAIFSLKAKNETTGTTTSARWEQDGLAVSRPGKERVWYGTELRSDLLEFKGKTPQEVATEFQELVKGEDAGKPAE